MHLTKRANLSNPKEEMKAETYCGGLVSWSESSYKVPEADCIKCLNVLHAIKTLEAHKIKERLNELTDGCNCVGLSHAFGCKHHEICL